MFLLPELSGCPCGVKKLGLWSLKWKGYCPIPLAPCLSCSLSMSLEVPSGPQYLHASWSLVSPLIPQRPPLWPSFSSIFAHQNLLGPLSPLLSLSLILSPHYFSACKSRKQAQRPIKSSLKCWHEANRFTWNSANQLLEDWWPRAAPWPRTPWQFVSRWRRKIETHLPSADTASFVRFFFQSPKVAAGGGPGLSKACSLGPICTPKSCQEGTLAKHRDHGR